MEVGVQWQSPSVINGIIRRFNVKVTQNRSEVVTEISSTGHDVVVSNLKPFTTYHVQVAAYTVSLGPYSEAITFQTLPYGKVLSLNINCNSNAI